MNVLIVLAVAVAALAGVIGQARRRATIRAEILAAPSTFEDNALVTFTGTVKRLGEPLIAPLSGKACVAYCAVARTYRPTMFGPRRRMVLEHEVADAAVIPFVLVAKTGEVFVDGDTCRFVEPGEPIIPRKLEREQTFLASHGLGCTPQGPASTRSASSQLRRSRYTASRAASSRPPAARPDFARHRRRSGSPATTHTR